MHPVVIDRTLHYGDVKILVARDDEQRNFVALNTGPRQRGRWVFLQVLPSTIAELEALTIDLHTVIAQRRIGMVFTADRDEVLQPSVWPEGVRAWLPPRPRPLGTPTHTGRPGWAADGRLSTPPSR